MFGRVVFSATLLTSCLVFIIWKHYQATPKPTPTTSYNRLNINRESVDLRVEDIITDEDKVHIEACDHVTEPRQNDR